MKNLCPIFHVFFWGGGGGESTLILQERADPAAPWPSPRGNQHRHRHQHSHGVRRRVFITIYNDITISIIIPSEIELSPS
jgi:hypothetical protein